MSKSEKMHTHKRRVAKGASALKHRRTMALIKLEQVAKPDTRQLAEIEILRKRVGHVVSTAAVAQVSADLETDD